MQPNNGTVADGHPVQGYYRLRRHKDGHWLPVCLWQQDGAWVARVGDAMADDVDAVWLLCARHKVAKADAVHAFEHGRWPGDAPAPIGNNLPPSDDPLEAITRKLEVESARVDAWIAEKHEGATAANLAANWLTELRKLEKETVAAFDMEKAPALAESNRIDGRWRGAKALAASIKQKMDAAYQAIGRKEKARLQTLADAKAKQEAEARQKQWEAEQARKAELAAEHNIPLEPGPALQLPLAASAPVKASFGGAQGNRIGVRKVPPTAVVEDWAKAAAHYSSHAKVREIIQKLAQHDAKDGRMEIPGVRIVLGE